MFIMNASKPNVSPPKTTKKTNTTNMLNADTAYKTNKKHEIKKQCRTKQQKNIL